MLPEPSPSDGDCGDDGIVLELITSAAVLGNPLEVHQMIIPVGEDFVLANYSCDTRIFLFFNPLAHSSQRDGNTHAVHIAHKLNEAVANSALQKIIRFDNKIPLHSYLVLVKGADASEVLAAEYLSVVKN